MEKGIVAWIFLCSTVHVLNFPQASAENGKIITVTIFLYVDSIYMYNYCAVLCRSTFKRWYQV